MYRKEHEGFLMDRQQPATFEIIGGDEPSDELLELLADMLLDMVDEQESAR